MPAKRPATKNKREPNQKASSRKEVEQVHPLSTSKSENMEVHYHTQLRHANSWTGHLIEFLMIFLAVTLGFFAENIREGITNNKKQKHYLQSLTEDIKSDTAQLGGYIRFKERVILYCDSFLFIISHSDVLKHSNAFYSYSKEMARYVRYYPADRTIEQLKNAGNMQLITRWEVSNAIADYYSKTKFMQEIDQELNDETARYRRYLIDFLDLSSYDRLNKPGSFMDNSNDTRGDPAFISNDPARLKIFYNEVFTLKAFLYNSVKSAQALIQNAEKLLALLQSYNRK